jgi:hypothetical protein
VTRIAHLPGTILAEIKDQRYVQSDRDSLERLQVDRADPSLGSSDDLPPKTCALGKLGLGPPAAHPDRADLPTQPRLALPTAASSLRVDG